MIFYIVAQVEYHYEILDCVEERDIKILFHTSMKQQQKLREVVAYGEE